MRKTTQHMRKAGAVLISSVSIAVVVSGCGGGGGGGSTASLSGLYGPSKSDACSSSPVRGGNLVYERQAATQTTDPLNPRNGNGDIFAYNLIYSGLVRSDPTGQTNKIVPSLSDRWTVSPDGKTYTFHLRPGIKFSNGQPVTSEDVAWTLNRFGNPKINGIMSAVATLAAASPVTRIIASQPAIETTATCPPREAIAGTMATSAHAVPITSPLTSTSAFSARIITARCDRR